MVAVNLIVIVGATGTGKSDFSLDLAEAFNRVGRVAEIVNADAMQLYRGMDIGTAKVPPSDRRGVPHHLIDVLEVTDEASVAEYQAAARAAACDIWSRYGIVLLVGGSGLYVASVIHDFRFPGMDAAIRSRLEDELAQIGPVALHKRLLAVDPETAAGVDPRNGRRIVRVLEVIELTGEPKAARLPDPPVAWHPHQMVHLRSDRALLAERLNTRALQMWDAGLVDEVRSLIPRGLEKGITARHAIGYRQALAQVQGRMSHADAIAETQQLTRRYARRQVSWFNRYRDATNFDANDPVARQRELARLVASPGSLN